MAMHTPVCGVGGIATQANNRVRITLKSRFNSYVTNICCLVIDRITQAILSDRININDVQIPEEINLADPEFYKSAKIDILIGAEIFFDLICDGRIKISKAQPIWQKTTLGWIASGNLISTEYKQQGMICNLTIDDQLNTNMRVFGKLSMT